MSIWCVVAVSSESVVDQNEFYTLASRVKILHISDEKELCDRLSGLLYRCDALSDDPHDSVHVLTIEEAEELIAEAEQLQKLKGSS